MTTDWWRLATDNIITMLRLRIANARRILKPLEGRDRTVDAAIDALDGVPRNDHKSPRD